eukprot:421096-Hanusia_phi.AAC.1
MVRHAMRRSKSWSSSSFSSRDRKFDLFNDTDQKLETSLVLDNMLAVFRKKMNLEKPIDKQYDQAMKESQLQQQEKLVHFNFSDESSSNPAYVHSGRNTLHDDPKQDLNCINGSASVQTYKSIQDEVENVQIQKEGDEHDVVPPGAKQHEQAEDIPVNHQSNERKCSSGTSLNVPPHKRHEAPHKTSYYITVNTATPYKIICASGTWLDRFGFHADEVLGRSLRLCYGPLTNAASLSKALTEANNSTGSVNHLATLYDRNGKQVLCSMNINAKKDEEMMIILLHEVDKLESKDTSSKSCNAEIGSHHSKSSESGSADEVLGCGALAHLKAMRNHRIQQSNA